MEAFFVSTAIVALAEMGDKTQLLSLVLAARFRKPWPIVLGIFVATLANHALAGALGAWVTQLLALVLAARFRTPWPIVWGIFVATVFNHALAGAAGAWITTLIGPQMLRWVLGVSFIAMAVWMLIPDKLEDGDTGEGPRWGVFGTTVVAFFLAEMGDKTQIATVMLAAQYSGWLWVVAGTTLGMMLANAPVVWLGERITRRIPLRTVHVVSAGIFLVLGILALWVPA